MLDFLGELSPDSFSVELKDSFGGESRSSQSLLQLVVSKLPIHHTGHSTFLPWGEHKHCFCWSLFCLQLDIYVSISELLSFWIFIFLYFCISVFLYFCNFVFLDFCIFCLLQGGVNQEFPICCDSNCDRCQQKGEWNRGIKKRKTSCIYASCNQTASILQNWDVDKKFQDCQRSSNLHLLDVDRHCSSGVEAGQHCCTACSGYHLEFEFERERDFIFQ